MAVSNNRDEAFHYKTIYMRKKWAEHRAWGAIRDSSDLGEVAAVEYKATGIKEQLREIGDLQRASSGKRLRGGTHADRALLDRRRDLVLEAHDRGWSHSDIARALRCSSSSAGSIVKKALAWREEQEGEVAA